MNWLTSRETPQDFSDYYQKSIQIALKEAADNPRGFMLVRYEDFVNQQKITLQNICDFLEVPYEQECLLTNKEEQFDPLHSGIDPYRNSSIKKVTKDWRDFINEDEAKSLENQLSEIISQLDYPRYT